MGPVHHAVHIVLLAQRRHVLEWQTNSRHAGHGIEQGDTHARLRNGSLKSMQDCQFGSWVLDVDAHSLHSLLHSSTARKALAEEVDYFLARAVRCAQVDNLVVALFEV